MPLIETIKASEAPGVPRKQSAYANELVSAINSLRKDEVLRVSPDTEKSLRGVKTGIGRITKSAGVKVTVWDDGEVVYISRS